MLKSKNLKARYWAVSYSRPWFILSRTYGFLLVFHIIYRSKTKHFVKNAKMQIFAIFNQKFKNSKKYINDNGWRVTKFYLKFLPGHQIFFENISGS